MVYTANWGMEYAIYHLLGEPETTIEVSLFPSIKEFVCRKKTHPKDSGSFSAIVSACIQNNNWEMAMHFLEDFKSTDFKATFEHHLLQIQVPSCLTTTFDDTSSKADLKSLSFKSTKILGYVFVNNFFCVGSRVLLPERFAVLNVAA